MSSPHRHRFSVSTKVALGIIVVVAIVAFLYYSPGSVSLGKLGEVKLGLPDIFGERTEAGEDKLTFTITSGESLLKGSIGLENASVTVGGTHKSDASIGEAVFDTANKDAEVTFRGFVGVVVFEGDSISVQGTATSAVSEGATIKPKAEKFSVEAELSPSSYTIDPIEIGSFKLANISGNMEKLGKESSTVQLSDSTIDISNFEGIATLSDGTHRLAGTATRVKGESFTLEG